MVILNHRQKPCRAQLHDVLLVVEIVTVIVIVAPAETVTATAIVDPVEIVEIAEIADHLATNKKVRIQ
jgi:hypothetical protein